MKTQPRIEEYSAVHLLEQYSSGELSPIAVTESLIDRIHRIDPLLRAFLAVDEIGARKAAREAEQSWQHYAAGGPRPPGLCGIPVSVKDTIEVEGMPTTYGSLALKDNYAPDSAIGSRLRAAGAVIVGKTNTSEFALSTITTNRLTPPTRNPLALDKSAGGSSGGAAAAVCAGLGPVGIGTDSAGSVRIPAAFVGVVGFKPSRDAIPVVQRWRASPTRSHPGILARSVKDVEITFEALTDTTAHHDPLPLHGMQVACAPTDDEAVSAAVDLLGQLGCNVRRDIPPLPNNNVPTTLSHGIWPYAAEHYAAAEEMEPGFFHLHADELTPYARRLYAQGAAAPAWEYRQVLNSIGAFARRLDDWFASFDFLVTPIDCQAPNLPDPAEEGELGAPVPELAIWNLGGHPAICIPITTTGSGAVPLSVQIVGRRGTDRLLLAAASALEAIRPWRWTLPELPPHGDGSRPIQRSYL
jgi:Asp-tRNA(Asn)/Glu-tRNA(Gln) amidotransferase A subunit family amidase